MSLTRPDLSVYGITSSWHKQEVAERTILVVYAHPDDESFGSAGMIARYTGAGVAVHYACATRGECGEVDPKFLEGYADIAALRTAELECAAVALGLTAVHYLGYRDSGMAGALDNQHPNAFAGASLERVTGQIVALIRELKPQIVVTFNPYGGYGHPDHIKAYEAAHAAFEAAGDPTYSATGLLTWTPGRLYYATFPTFILRLGIYSARLLLQNPRRLGTNKDVDLVEAVRQATPVTTDIKCGAYLAHKDAAWRCHRSQLGGTGTLLKVPVALRRPFTGSEGFTRAIPAWEVGQPKEKDFFEGL